MPVTSDRIGNVSSRRSRLRRAVGVVVEGLEPRRLMHFDPNDPDHFDPVPLTPVGTSAQLSPHVGPFVAAGASNSIPALNSDPDATAQLYLDFNGYASTSWAGKTTGVTPAYDNGTSRRSNDAHLVECDG